MNTFRKYLGGIFATLFFLGLGILILNTSEKSIRKKTIVFAVVDSNAEALVKATDLFYTQYPKYAKDVEIIIRTPSNIGKQEAMPPNDIFVIEVLDKDFFNEHLDYIKKNKKTLIRNPGSPKLSIAMGHVGNFYKEEDYSNFGLVRDSHIDSYHENGSPEDYKKLIVYLLNRFERYADLVIEPPTPIIKDGFAVFKKDRVVKLVETWEEWEREQKPDSSRDKIAVLINPTVARSGLLNLENKIGANLLEKGYEPVFVFGYPGSSLLKNKVIDTLKLRNRGVKAAISWLFKFSDKNADKVLPILDVPLINAIKLYGISVSDWQNSKKGLSSGEIGRQIAVPEIAGLVQPTVVGGTKIENGIPYDHAIDSRVEKIVNRAIRYAKLQNQEIKNRKIAILYWNYPPGKDNIGASYLNVLESLPNILSVLKREGYHTGSFNEKDKKNIQNLIKERGRNVGRYAPGELERIVNAGGAILVPLSEYKKWFEKLEKNFQLQIINHWGPPEKADIMTINKGGKMYFVLPRVNFGNINLMPQADRAKKSQDLASLYHSQTLPPHHQYVCQYLWLQRNTDVIIHTGTHGTHEWLDGKETGLGDTDSPEVLAGDLPIMYIYNMDVVGEGIQAKRRGVATIIDHLTPSLGEAGFTPEMKKLDDLIRNWESTKALNPDGMQNLLAMIDQEATKIGVKKDLEKNGWSMKSNLKDEPPQKVNKMIAELQDYMQEIKSRSTPFGLHTFGVSPNSQRLEQFSELIAKTNGKARKGEFRQKLINSGEEEIRMLLHGLNGKYVLPQVGNDPIRSPNAIPTGRNFYTFDPRDVPIPYSDSIGKILAENYIADFKESNGRYPKKLAFEVWSNETIRHQGLQEAQILAMLGVKVKRNKLGKVEGVELIPREKLGRPRVDVLMSTTALYRDTFPMFIELMDEAFRLAAESPEEDNPVRKNSEKLRLELIRAGVDDEQARLRSQIRIFAEPSGTYGSKISDAAYSSGSWDESGQVAELYIRRMGNGYGKAYWGESMEKEFRASLSGTEGIIHSRSSSLYMTLDNDDFFAFAGAIAMGVRHVDKSTKSPPIMVADLRVKGDEKITSVERFMGQELRSRYFNPEYIKAMTKEGYAGAKHIMQGVEYLWGWQVVYPEVVNGQKWQEFYDIWLKDKYNLKTDEFFEEHSPHARESISARMMEAIRKGYWRPKKEVEQDIARIYTESVARHGVSCGHTTCDHPELISYIKKVALSNPSVKVGYVNKMINNVQKATGKSIGQSLKRRIADKKEFHDLSKVKKYDPNAPQKDLSKQSSQKAGTKHSVKGYKMVEQKIISHHNQSMAEKQKGVRWFVPLVFLCMVGCMSLGGVVRYRTNKIKE